MTVKFLSLPLRAQVRRSARAMERGTEILEFVEGSKAALIKAAEQGVPPVGAISHALAKKFPEQIAVMAVRQFIGTAVKATLQSEDFEIAQSGVRIPGDPVFKTGSIYRKALPKGKAPAEQVRSDLFARMIEGLSLAEKRLLIGVLKRSLGVDGNE